MRHILALPFALALAAAPLSAFAQTDVSAEAVPASEATAAAVEAGTYGFDADHSQIVFHYNHMGFSTSFGFVNGLSGEAVLDPADPAKSTITASFPLSKLQTVSKGLDEHLMGDDFFKGAAPDTQVTFVSTEVAPDGDNKAKVTGDLTLNGVTKPVVLDVTLNKAAPSPMTNVATVGFEATTEIKRSDFNLGAFVPAVSDEVQIRIDAEMNKQ
ncbi:MAG: YceI family protein [Paracoccus sp. (in: a-proteobacteria)]|uniref:YceI family protein n=1 Tax=Paracoccus sp. TaxID=267 RepID=UPI0026DEA77E|nr:YceI family protein [Paracoccus sp. (in: a-proteobacteria)]MDO5620193.1 YceI family protein [Paracoccus sp. (in: a-proteobacteria)]